MDGPELSHLLDGADTEQPSSEVLDCIVLRHRRQRARRARVAASLGLVMVIAAFVLTTIGLTKVLRQTKLRPRIARLGGFDGSRERVGLTVRNRGSTSRRIVHGQVEQFGSAGDAQLVENAE